jgi:hypothetical protein
LPAKHKKIFQRTFIALAILVAGCGIFDTRTPEEPGTGRSTFIPPTAPGIVVRNLSYSLQEKNSNNYANCINQTSYSYVPDSKSQLLYETIFRDWNANSEKFYLDNLISQTNAGASSYLFLTDTVTTLISSDSSIATGDYIVVFQHNKTNIPKSSVGSFRLIITSEENNFFYIEKWEDFRKNDSDFTWSELKANFSY